ncbi:MAG TPA: NADH:ubiquinone reductase (Na(+)-transporting) subunit C [Paludibacter sp.]|nr:NADH:ubiquinone reductase (Na(+)-transporting) subunit C [Paludibacter sp.]
MDTNNNGYTLVYAAIMVVVVAFMLVLVSGALKSTQESNVKLDKKKQILSSLKINTEGLDAAALYDKYIAKAMIVNTKGEVVSGSREEAFDIDMGKELSKKAESRRLPVFIANIDGKTKYIVMLRGTGLWGPIWGYISLDDDKNTVYGVYFSHASETPGLGANITEQPFRSQFVGKHILNDKNKFVSIAVMKSGKTAVGKEQVDAISGGTITSKGVESMLLNCIGQYDQFFKQTSGGDK